MCAIYAIKITELIITCVICCYNVVICYYILGDFPIDAFFAIYNLRAQKVLYSAKKPHNAEVVFPDVAHRSNYLSAQLVTERLVLTAQLA